MPYNSVFYIEQEIGCSSAKFCTTYQEHLEMRKDDPDVAYRGVNTKWPIGRLPYKRKDGSLGRTKTIVGAPYTVLNTCDGCGRLSTPRNVSPRGRMSWTDSSYKYRSLGCGESPYNHYYLCVACWNKVRPLEKATKVLDELETVIREVDRTRLRIQKEMGL